MKTEQDLELIKEILIANNDKLNRLVAISRDLLNKYAVMDNNFNPYGVWINLDIPQPLDSMEIADPYRQILYLLDCQKVFVDNVGSVIGLDIAQSLRSLRTQIEL